VGRGRDEIATVGAERDQPPRTQSPPRGRREKAEQRLDEEYQIITLSDLCVLCVLCG
jgi:hypothetical protein